MKASEIKYFLKIYYKKIKEGYKELQKKELTLLWRAIRAKLKKDRLAKEQPQKVEQKPKKEKKITYEEQDEKEDWELD